MLNRFELEELKKKKFTNLRELRNGDKSLNSSLQNIKNLKENFSVEKSVSNNKNFSIENRERIFSKNKLTSRRENETKRLNKSNDFNSPRNV